MYGSIDEILKDIPKHRAAFEMQVEAVSLEVTDIAKQVSKALGDVSMYELKEAIIKEFSKRLREPVKVL